MRYRLRTLLIVVAIAPPVLALVWYGWNYFDNTTPMVLINKGGGPTQYIDDPALWP
jgi:hypothetical protein